VAYVVAFKPAAVRDLRKLPEDARRRVAARIDALAAEPRPAGVEALQGASDLYRIRVGDYRVLYQLRRTALVVLVVRIGHRRDVYRRMGRKS
jgi:mRNA interferase RelE/StbE